MITESNENHRLELPRYAKHHGRGSAYGRPEAMGPDVIFLSKTHVNTTRVEKSMTKLKMDHVEVGESVGTVAVRLISS